MNNERLILSIAVMAVVTYAIRMLPFALVKGKIRSTFLRSFIYYVPYAVLSAMTIPSIFYSTSTVLSAVIGLVVAMIVAYFDKGLLTVALSACGAVLITEWMMMIL